MPEIKFTKNELRAQQQRLAQLRKYLPTLQLKKALLQLEVHEARLQITELQESFDKLHSHIQSYSALLTDKFYMDPLQVAKVAKVKKHYENIAGVEVPVYEGADFEEISYSLVESPPWLDTVIAGLRGLTESKIRLEIAHEKKQALENELRQVSIRVNLFEKVLIPRSLGNIKKIRVFLGDQQLATVSQLKVAKAKIVERKLARKEGVNNAS